MIPGFKKETIEEYRIEEEYGIEEVSLEGKTRKAMITIIGGIFDDCEYSGVGNRYTLEDWVFLHKVASKIIELTKVKIEVSKDKKCR